ncbi:protein FAM47E-like [Branchiostoma floridae]|uniref:Protein FAM47E-like n=1 Tax=Branchiostoma floridae TaxID=7739 RepID=A0A9J7MKX5_BRAFL|nr:protein FAM47E-like [Branchiostoma floridae]
MAQNKYDLSLVRTVTGKKIREQPWWKERLHTKYAKRGDKVRMLHGKAWTFVRPGMDDFRDGKPPAQDQGIIKGDKGPGPVISGTGGESPGRREHRGPVFTKEEMVYSKALPRQQNRRSHIDELEYGLLQHPLALYPHLEDCMPPDLFEEVVDVLDPEMNLGSEFDDEILEEEEEEDAEDNSQSQDRIKEEEEEVRTTTEVTDEATEDLEAKARNPYKWLFLKEETPPEETKASKKRSMSPSQDERLKAVTKDFCDWCASLGGESNNVEESTITSLFASGYETKPALSVPIHVVELTNVPPELRMSTNVSPEPVVAKSILATDMQVTRHQALDDSYKPSWVKVKYGAWYLDPITWKKRLATEPLQDPNELSDKDTTEAKKKSRDLDAQLSQMHGASAFNEFIEKKVVRKPEFLQRVAEYQERALQSSDNSRSMSSMTVGGPSRRK